jgi:hypothetical protein
MRPTHGIAACVFALVLAACTHTADLTSATARIVNGEAVVEVALDRRDVQVIKDRELYFSIVLVECADKSKRFPLQPYLDGKMVEGGNFPSVESTTVHGTIPATSFQRYGQPCALLEGGGYFSGKLTSQPIPVMLATAKDGHGGA